jgi:hypothetical protein
LFLKYLFPSAIHSVPQTKIMKKYAHVPDVSGKHHVNATMHDRVFSNAVHDRVFSNDVHDRVFSNAVHDRVFSNAVHDRVFSNDVHDRVFSNGVHDQEFRNATVVVESRMLENLVHIPLSNKYS